MSGEMCVRRIPHFDLSQIWRSGQCFRMTETAPGLYAVISGGRYLEVRQQGEECRFYCTDEEVEHFWKEYFDLGADYGGYIRRIAADDAYLAEAARFGSGIRILRQDLWETIVSFLISQQNHIIRIRRCIENLCVQYGEARMNSCGEIYHAFPRPETLAVLDDDALKACNLGYRSKYVVRAAGSVARGDIDLDKLPEMSYPQARAELLKLYGVGGKVADCICLFGLHRLQAFPVDTHIRQALEAHYQSGFPFERYEGIQGVMQQYMFYYEVWGKSIRN